MKKYSPKKQAIKKQIAAKSKQASDDIASGMRLAPKPKMMKM